MLAALASILALGVTFLPLVVAIAKASTKIFAFFRFLFGAAKGTAATSGIFGIVMALLTFTGGISLVVFIVYNFSLEFYLKLINVVISPFGLVLKAIISVAVSQFPASLPQGFASLLGIFNFSAILSLFVVGVAFEFYLRLITIYFVRRGK